MKINKITLTLTILCLLSGLSLHAIISRGFRRRDDGYGTRGGYDRGGYDRGSYDNGRGKRAGLIAGGVAAGVLAGEARRRKPEKEVKAKIKKAEKK